MALTCQPFWPAFSMIACSIAYPMTKKVTARHLISMCIKPQKAWTIESRLSFIQKECDLWHCQWVIPAPVRYSLICNCRPVSDHMTQIVGHWYQPPVLPCRLILGLNPHKAYSPRRPQQYTDKCTNTSHLFGCMKLISWILKIEAIIMQWYTCRLNWKTERVAFVTFSKVWLRLPESSITALVILATGLSAARTNQTGLVLDMLI